MPTAPSTEARQDLVAALSGIGMPVLAYVPPVPKPPCVVVLPDSPWMTQAAMHHTAVEVNFRLLVVISPRTAQSATLDSENAVAAVLEDLPQGFTMLSVGPPTLTDIGPQGTVATTEINLRVTMKG